METSFESVVFFMINQRNKNVSDILYTKVYHLFCLNKIENPFSEKKSSCALFDLQWDHVMRGGGSKMVNEGGHDITNTGRGRGGDDLFLEQYV